MGRIINGAEAVIGRSSNEQKFTKKDIDLGRTGLRQKRGKVERGQAEHGPRRRWAKQEMGEDTNGLGQKWAEKLMSKCGMGQAVIGQNGKEPRRKSRNVLKNKLTMTERG